MKYLLLAIFGLSVALISPETTRADVNDFVINNFHVEYLIDNDVVGGSLQTKEEVTVTYSDQNHGILRALPKKHQGYDTKLKIVGVSRDGSSEQYSSYSENGNLVLKIGSPDRTITGQHSYTIQYSQERIVNFKEGADFFWDVNGNQWSQPFEKVSATVRLVASGLGYGERASCFSGAVESLETDCTSSISQDEIIFETSRKLLAYENLTINVPLNPEEFVAPTYKDTLKDNIWSFVGLGLGVIGALVVYSSWRRNGKDYRGRGVIIPEYSPPKGLSPAEVGMLADYRVDTRDVTSTIIDLAIRGYIKLHEDVKKILLFSTKKYSIELITTDQTGLKKHEIAILDMIFSTKTSGEKIAINKLDKSKVSSSLTAIRKNIKTELVDNYGLIESKSYKMLGWYVGSGIAVIILQFIFGFMPWGFHVGFILIGAALIISGLYMVRRSHAGVEIYEQIMGLKLYMGVAEKNRLEITQSTKGAKVMPEKTVDLFEKLLPFAVALGVEKSWAKQFDGILTAAPTWISGNSVAALSGANLASSIAGVSSSFGSSFESSSGASSGGSGGGGGGGGGGGW